MMRFARLQPLIARHNAVLYYWRQHKGGRIADLYKTREGVPAGLHSFVLSSEGCRRFRHRIMACSGNSATFIGHRGDSFEV